MIWTKAVRNAACVDVQNYGTSKLNALHRALRSNASQISASQPAT